MKKKSEPIIEYNIGYMTNRGFYISKSNSWDYLYQNRDWTHITFEEDSEIKGFKTLREAIAALKNLQPRARKIKTFWGYQASFISP